jgi:hypothetical protein
MVAKEMNTGFFFFFFICKRFPGVLMRTLHDTNYDNWLMPFKMAMIYSNWTFTKASVKRAQRKKNDGR